MLDWILLVDLGVDFSVDLTCLRGGWPGFAQQIPIKIPAEILGDEFNVKVIFMNWNLFFGESVRVFSEINPYRYQSGCYSKTWEKNMRYTTFKVSSRSWKQWKKSSVIC